MTFYEWIQEQTEVQSKKAYALLEETAKATQISMTTLKAVYHGATIATYAKAKALSEHTQGKVSVEELCPKS